MCISCKNYGIPAILTDPNLPSGTDGIASALQQIDPDGTTYEEKEVIVSGGGNVAMDVARTIKKQGAKNGKQSNYKS